MTQARSSRTLPAFAVSALSAALLLAFPTAHADARPTNVSATGHDHVNLKPGQRYDSLTASHGGEITGRRAAVTGNPGDLVTARDGGRISLEDVRIESGKGSRRHRGKHDAAVSAVGGSHGHRSTTIELEDGSVSTRADHAAALSAKRRGARIEVDGTRLKTYGDDSDVAMARDGGTIRLDRADVDSYGDGSRGVSVSGRGSTASVRRSSIETRGRGADGVQVRDGGDAHVHDSRIRTRGSSANGVSVAGRGSDVSVERSQIDTRGKQAVGVRVDERGEAAIDRSLIITRGKEAHGVEVDDRGEARIQRTVTLTTGEGADGVRVDDAGRAAIARSIILTQGRGAEGVAVQGKDSAVSIDRSYVVAAGRDADAVSVRDGATAVITRSSLSGSGTGLHAEGKGSKALAVGVDVSVQSARDDRRSRGPAGAGVWAEDGARIGLLGGRVSASGDGSVGLWAEGGALDVLGTRVSASGANAAGVVASRESGGRRHGHGDTSAVKLSHASVAVSGEDGAGLVAAGRGASLEASSTRVVAEAGAVGVAALDGGAIALKRSTVQSSSANTAGALVGGITSWRHRAVSSLDVNGGRIIASGEDSAGILLHNSADLHLQGTTVEATGASMVSKLDRGKQTQTITVGAGTTMVQNNGTLLRVERSEGAGSSKVTLDLQDDSITSGNIIDQGEAFTGDGGTYVTIGAKASYTGLMSGVRDVDTIGGDQQLNFQGGSSMRSLHIDNNATTSGGTVDSRIAASSDVTVDSATLGGNWHIGGTLTSLNGGVIRPGNSVGVVTTSAIDWQEGTVYSAEINAAGQSDLVEVTDAAADLSHTKLSVSSENGTGGIRLNYDYTILTATGGIAEKFQDATWAGHNYPLLQLQTLYQPNAVAVRMGVNESALAAMPLTRNQRAAAYGALSVVGGNPTADATFLSDDPAMAFDQVSGEAHATVRSMLFGDVLSTGLAIRDQLRANLVATPRPGEATASADATADGVALPDSGTMPLWAKFNAAEQVLDGDGNAAGSRYSSSRLLVGGDAGIGGGWRLGAAAGVASGDFRIKDRSSSGELRNYSFTLYGGNSWEGGVGRLNLLLGGGYTRHDVETRRQVSLAGGQSLKADYHGGTWQAFGDLGYAIPWGTDNTAEPYVNVTWLNQRMDGFDESGGSGALRAKRDSMDLRAYTLGLRSALVFAGKTSTVTLRGNLGWRYADGDVSPTRTLSFIEGSGTAFTVAGAPIGRNSAVVGVSAELRMNRYLSMGLAYDGQYGSGNADSSGSLFMRARF